MSVYSGTLTLRSVHPASPVLLTKNGPLGAPDSMARLTEAAAPLKALHSNVHVQLSNKDFLHI